MTPGIIYSEFHCGCIIPKEEDMQRSKRHIRVPGEPGSKKVKALVACPNHFDTTGLFKHKIRVCAACGETTTSKHGIVGENCKSCSRVIWVGNNKEKLRENQAFFRKKIKERTRLTANVYYQAGKEIPAPEELVIESDCILRPKCLTFTTTADPTRSFLHCGDCRYRAGFSEASVEQYVEAGLA